MTASERMKMTASERSEAMAKVVRDKTLTSYEKMKAMVEIANDELLIEAYKKLHFNENSTVEEALAYTVLTNELESRNLIQFNESTWEYEIKVS